MAQNLYEIHLNFTSNIEVNTQIYFDEKENDIYF
jgi:hypothetical protein